MTIALADGQVITDAKLGKLTIRGRAPNHPL
jgi:hypothetical protein